MRPWMVGALLMACNGATVGSSAPSITVPDWVDELHVDAQPVVREGYAYVMSCGSQSGTPPVGEVSIMIGTQNGRVKTWAVLVNETGQPQVAECILERARKWRFPKGFDESMKLRFEYPGQ